MSGKDALKTRMDELERKIDAGREEDRMRVVGIQKEDLLNKEVKAYENNIKVVGLKYNIESARKRDEAGRAKWRTMILQKILVDTKLVKPEKVFYQAPKELKGKEIRGILRDAHPLRQENNAAIVVAFCESWFASSIKERSKDKRGLILGDLKIHEHLPPIIDQLKNEALRERRRLMNDEGGHIICSTTMTKPWVSLLKVVDGKKVALPFVVEDGRLAEPAKTLATLALNGNQKFVPLKFLSSVERDAVAKNVTVQPQNTRMDTE